MQKRCQWQQNMRSRLLFQSFKILQDYNFIPAAAYVLCFVFSLQVDRSVPRSDDSWAVVGFFSSEDITPPQSVHEQLNGPDGSPVRVYQLRKDPRWTVYALETGLRNLQRTGVDLSKSILKQQQFLMLSSADWNQSQERVTAAGHQSSPEACVWKCDQTVVQAI